MNYHDYLKKRFPPYVLTGVVLALSVFTLLTAHRYSNHLLDTQDMINIMSLNKNKVKNEANKIHAFSNSLSEEFNLDLETASSEGLIFEALDKIKAHLKDTSVAVSTLEETNGLKELPIAIETQARNFRMILDHLHYLESFRLPVYKIRNLSIRRDDTGEVLLTINGVLAMPGIGS